MMTATYESKQQNTGEAEQPVATETELKIELIV